MSTIKPLVSDWDLAGWDSTKRYLTHEYGTREKVRSAYEADRAELIGLLERLNTDAEAMRVFIVNRMSFKEGVLETRNFVKTSAEVDAYLKRVKG